MDEGAPTWWISGDPCHSGEPTRVGRDSRAGGGRVGTATPPTPTRSGYSSAVGAPAKETEVGRELLVAILSVFFPPMIFHPFRDKRLKCFRTFALQRASKLSGDLEEQTVSRLLRGRQDTCPDAQMKTKKRSRRSFSAVYFARRAADAK